MKQTQNDSFIGSKTKIIPTSTLLYSQNVQLLLQAKRKIITLNSVQQTLVYANIQDNKVIHTAYHNELQLYILLTSNSLLAINKNGEYIKKFNNNNLVESKYLFISTYQDGYKHVPNQRHDFMVFIKEDHLYTAQALFFYQRHLLKNRAICDISLQVSNIKINQSPQFIDNNKYLQKLGYLILWNISQTYIYKMPKHSQQKFQRILIYNKISKRQNNSLDYAISVAYKLLVVSCQSGVIKIFQFDYSKKYIVQLKGHQAACTTVFINNTNPVILYSASLDSTVRIWNLKDYQQVYLLQLDILLKQVYFINQTLLFGTSQGMHEKSYLCYLNTNLLDPVLNQNKNGILVKIRCDKDWCVLIYSNSYVQFLSIRNTHQNIEHQKMEYPEKYGNVKDVFKLSNNHYAVTMEKGFSLIQFQKQKMKSQNFQLKKLVYNQSMVRLKEEKGNKQEFIELIHEKLLGSYLFQVLQDWKDIATSIKVSSIYVHSNKWLAKWDGSNHEKTNIKQKESIYCMIGTNKGQIFFVDITRKSHYYSKVIFHSSSILFMRQLLLQNKVGTNYFISLSFDQQLTIWIINHNEPPQALVNINYNIQISFIQVFNNYLIIGQKQGILNILQVYLQRQEIKMKKSNNNTGHLRSIVSGDYIKYNQFDIFLTGGEDSVIKIWKGIQKQLIFSLKMFGIITALNFIHQQLNIIVCQNDQISILREQKINQLFRVRHQLLSNKNISQYQIQQINIRRFFNKQKQFNSSRRFILNKLLTKNIKIGNSVNYNTEKQIQNILNQCQEQKSSQTVKKADSLDKINKKNRFHILSRESQLDLMLPVIKTRQSVENKNKNNDNYSFFTALEELKQVRKKFLSKAGKQRY